MYDIDQEVNLLGCLSGWKRKVAQSKELIQRALEIPGRWSVSFSGGKDSTVLLDLALSVNSDLDIIWFDDGWDYPETITFLAETEIRLSKKIIRVPFPLKSKFWKSEIGYGGDDPYCDHTGDMAYSDWIKQFAGSLIGMRKDESTQRLFTLGRSPLYFAQTDKQWHCSPLAPWHTEDIWGYIGANNLAYNQVYRKLFDLGTPLKMSRVGPITSWMVYNYGVIATLKQGWPDLYNRFMAAHPGAGAYT